MNLTERFNHFVQQNKLFTPAQQLLVACSGGVDSVVLCHLLSKLGYRFAIAHCNFQLRNEESKTDELFVQQLAEELKVPFFVTHFATEKFAQSHKLSIQMAARQLRYEWFYTLLNGTESKIELHYLLTAHHANDHIETVLMNFFKGSGISGFHGILPKSGKLVRPLIFADKTAIVNFAQTEQLRWVEDSSNESDKYTRNFFRHRVIPMVNQIIPEANENLLTSIKNMQEAEIIYQKAIEQYRKKLLVQKGSEIHIPVLKLVKMQPLNTILYEIVKVYGFVPGQLPDIVNLLKSETGKYIASASHRIIKNREWLIIAAMQSADSQTFLIETPKEKITTGSGILSFDFITWTPAEHIEKSSSTALLDAAQIHFPLIVRKWKPGDYFYPLGMPKKKKLARFLIDQKISTTEKEKIWVIESNKKIIWVVNHRIDDRFKITAKTTRALCITNANC